MVRTDFIYTIEPIGSNYGGADTQAAQFILIHFLESLNISHLMML